MKILSLLFRACMVMYNPPKLQKNGSNNLFAIFQVIHCFKQRHSNCLKSVSFCFQLKKERNLWLEHHKGWFWIILRWMITLRHGIFAGDTVHYQSNASESASESFRYTEKKTQSKKRESQKACKNPGRKKKRAVCSERCPEILAALLQIPSQFPPAEIDTLVDGLGWHCPQLNKHNQPIHTRL